MHKIIIFGNSGSGKSTLAKHLAKTQGLTHLDLDTIAWLDVTPPERRPMEQSVKSINHFLQHNTHWVIEGCYADLIEYVAPSAHKLIFLNLSVTDCVTNAKNRPWEPHKYPSQQAQDENLTMLIEWIKQYPSRDDTFSLTAHKKLYQAFKGEKEMRTENEPT
ncbi:shikimate kinase [Saccharobesus litoralis]|uniref:Shikimate kinase n=1 Tax=Saccharobesus litoralis TaxID=2172099 RepID=A0A2S0VP88_9ALTE|nr:AAA family ATPase [Saccharobesus litoralis]AWB66035.1 shikimate kinase [Saccharobesus litoralis]